MKSKKMYLLTSTLIVLLSLGITFWTRGVKFQQNPWKENIEALSDGDDGSGCIGGGPGSAECSLNISIEVGVGGAASCSVKCWEGYYACCTLTGCHCIPN